MFKSNFVWGAATAAYQIEGAAFEDGRGLSVWDVFSARPGNVLGGHTGAVACDHYHRYKEDITVMKEIGIKAYRFSISWPRLIPDGTGRINPKGLKFYNDLIDELIKNGIEPYITLFHWDYPQELFRKGGWLNDESPRWFEFYAKTVAECFSDRVKNFITINEPQCFIGNGHENGIHAPGLKYSEDILARIVHNVLLSHGLAVKALRENAAQELNIGCALTGVWSYPYNENSDADIKAAYDKNFAMPEKLSTFNIVLWNDPIYFGRYPKEFTGRYGKYLPPSWEKDLDIISEPLDFIGQNIYTGNAVRASEGGYEFVPKAIGNPRTAMNWSIEPKALKWCAKFLYERYKKPVYITENGLSCRDVVSLDGKVHDPARIDFLNRYLLALGEAAEEGADIGGYFQWSLMDNYEWQEGYRERFGLVYVDYETQERIVKDSGYWYKKVVDTNGEYLKIAVEKQKIKI